MPSRASCTQDRVRPTWATSSRCSKRPSTRRAQRKALLRGLVVDIRVKSREAIHPTFRLPAGPGRVTDQRLRVRLRWLERGSCNANPPTTIAGAPIKLAPRDVWSEHPIRFASESQPPDGSKRAA
jgi:hypothetical protein